MRSFNEIINSNKLLIKEKGLDGGNAIAILPGCKNVLFVVFSNGGGWDHVSVSLKHRCPTWDEMCMIKDIFFEEDECVIQYHPKKSEYVNFNKYTLHMWKPQNLGVPTPPIIFV